jgi:2-oxoacid:acceptor oxidoreductase delta subunit (pyruvate/2-ketoisovalerate family)
MSSNKYFKTEGPWSDAKVEILCSDTGGWRSERPVVDEDKCILCGLCAIYCPIQIVTEQTNCFSSDLTYCKGCGICAQECPTKAITMISEGEFK